MPTASITVQVIVCANVISGPFSYDKSIMKLDKMSSISIVSLAPFLHVNATWYAWKPATPQLLAVIPSFGGPSLAFFTFR